jgi:hypothetical protein
MKMPTSSRIVAGLLVATVAYWLVWPTPWVYGTVGNEMLRVNRFTGTKQFSTDDGWLTTDEIGEKSKRRYARQFAAKIADLEAKAKSHRIASASLRADETLRVNYIDGQFDLFYGGEAGEESAVVKTLKVNGIRVDHE